MSSGRGTGQPHPPSAHILGMRVDRVAPGHAVAQIVDAAKANKPGYCCITNVHQCILTYDDPDFRAVVNGAELALPDSTILRHAVALRYGLRAPPVLRGAELMTQLCAAAERKQVRVALVGGRDETVLARLVANLRERFPRLEIALAYSPPFELATPQEVEKLAGQLRRSGAQLIFVGLGCPKQERWMAQFKPRLSAMMIGVGAAFDFNAGVVKPSPVWVHKVGLEWLYRLASEPRRLWRRYLTTSPRFIALLALDALRPRKRSRG